jgi:hypothetical protein
VPAAINIARPAAPVSDALVDLQPGTPLLIHPRAKLVERHVQGGSQHVKLVQSTAELSRGTSQALLDRDDSLLVQRRQSEPRRVEAQTKVPADGSRRSSRPPRGRLPVLDRNSKAHYHVEAIVRSRQRAGIHEGLVKWLGYPRSQSTWLAWEALREDCPDLVLACEQSHPSWFQ